MYTLLARQPYCWKYKQKNIYFLKAILNQCPFLATKVGKKNFSAVSIQLLEREVSLS